RRTDRVGRAALVRRAVCRHGGGGRRIVLGARAAHPPLAPGSGAVAAVGGRDRGQRRGGDAVGGSGGYRPGAARGGFAAGRLGGRGGLTVTTGRKPAAGSPSAIHRLGVR